MDLPSKDFIIYDGDCGFCQNSVNIMKKLLGDKIEYHPNYKFGDSFYGVSQGSFSESIKFFKHIDKRIPYTPREDVLRYDFHEVHNEAVIYHGAYAIYKALSYNPLLSWILFLYKYLPGFSMVSEGVYKVIARNRHEISKMTGATECKIGD